MFFKYNKWAILWALIIFILCVIPGKDIPTISFLELLSFDKFVHACFFFGLILFTIRGFLLQTNFIKLQQSAKPIAFAICVIYGGSLEIIQGTLCVGRTASVYDFIADSFGAVLGLLFYKWMEKTFLARFIN